MLRDPSLEIRRDAVARLIGQGEALVKAGKRQEGMTAYREAMAAARDLDQVRLLAGRLRKLGETVDLARHLGYVVRWKVIGPFDNTGGKGFDAVYPPENEIRLDAEYQGKKGMSAGRTSLPRATSEPSISTRPSASRRRWPATP